MNARDDILGRIRAAVGRPDGGAPGVPAYAGHPLIPARGAGLPTALIGRFVEMAEEAAATVDRVATAADVPAAVAAFLARENLPAQAVVSPHARLDGLPWEATALSLRRGRAEADDAVSITPVAAGIAETGTLMVRSGPATPYTLNFLPDTHIAILHAADIVGSYEDAWARMRPAGETGLALPRTVTLITGPSRSSDIERTVTIGVHGPLRLHIVLVGQADGEAP